MWDEPAKDQANHLIKNSNINWDNFTENAVGESIAPILYGLVSSIDQFPGDILTRLNHYYYDSAVNNAILFRELNSLLLNLNNNQIEVILLKGSALATQIYPNIAMRPMVDLDILVKPKNVPGVIKVLQNNGYQLVRQEEQPGFTLNYENEIGLFKQDSIPKLIEIHWNLFNSIFYQYKIPTSWLWNSTTSISINNTPALMLNPEANLLHLCGHLSFHHFGKGWLWIHDLAEIIMHFDKNLDWEKLLDLAQQFDLVLALKTNLITVTEIYGQIIPIDFMQKLSGIEPSNGEVKYFSSLSMQHKTSGRTFLEDLSCLPDWRKKIHFAFSNIFPSLSYMKIRYRFNSPLMLPYFYIYRWYLGITSIFKHATA
jgi:hypothetical protein